MHLPAVRSPLRNRGRLAGTCRESVCRNGDKLKREPQPTFEGLIRSREAAKLLGISEWLLRKLAHEGELPYVHLGTTCPMLFDPLDLRRFVERKKIHNHNNSHP